MSSTGTQQVPAWKRLGLKLKPASASEPATGSPTVGQPAGDSSQQQQQGWPSKRKLDAPPPASSSQFAKRPRRDEATGDWNGQLKRQKSVTFAENPANNGKAPLAAGSKFQPTAQKKIKGPPKKQTPPTADVQAALAYLKEWKTSRDSWKFNKNHQASLIKRAFDADGIPAADIDAFYDYIQDLKGFTRMRLRDAALEIRTKDQSEAGAAFPAGTKDVDATQEKYESILARFLESQQVGAKRKGFTESDYLSSSDDGEVVVRRLVKRMRAELVIDELSDSGETDTSTTSSRTITASENNSNTTTTGTTDAEKKSKLNDGTVKRRRKVRVSNLEDSSSSESGSGDDSDTSSSGSSSDEDEDEEEEADPQARDEYDTSSSSSSSEAEGSGSDEDSSDEDAEKKVKSGKSTAT
ncbi:hypothetical protein G7046_g1112 [Stylonectria norvegica]|nr:hypothetical protein G7046_g1112 [Stylonectria norvegica]